MESSTPAVIANANLIISQPVPAKKPPTTGYGIKRTSLPSRREPIIRKNMPTNTEVKAMVTNINWNDISASQLFPVVVITDAAISAIIAIGISWGVLILIG